MKKYSITFQKSNEIIELENIERVFCPHLTVTSALIESFFPVLEYTSHISDEELFASNIQLNTLLDGDFAISDKWVIDINELKYAIENWIDLKILPPSRTNLAVPKEALVALSSMKLHLLKAPAVPIFTSEGFSRIHISDTLIPLAWAEVWYAIDARINARCCKYCGRIFILPPNNLRKATCLRPSCKMKYEIDRHGGPEGYRAWDRERRKAPSKRSPGRPKLNPPIDATKNKVGRPRKEIG